MDFRLRIVGITAILSVLIGLFIGGRIFSPERIQARAAARPLLSLSSPSDIASVEIVIPGSEALRLERTAGGWEAKNGELTVPASAERAQSLARLLAGLPRGALVSRDPDRAAGLGLEEDRARLLVIHRTGGRSDVALFVGARAPSGEEDYVRVRGEHAAYLARGNLSVLLSQDRTYWYDLSLFPDVNGSDIQRISVAGGLDLGQYGRLRGGYALVRAPEGRGDAEGQGAAGSPGSWSLRGQARKVDAVSAEAMASALARLEGDDLLAARGAAPAAALTVELTTREGRSYRLAAGPLTPGGKVPVAAGGSPWIYLVNPVLLRRAVLTESELLAGP
jgi:hypothetical protein